MQPDGGQVAAAAKRATSVEVGEIYRTASAFSIYLDEMENRPHINRLMSMPSMTDPQRIIDANHINPNIEVLAHTPHSFLHHILGFATHCKDAVSLLTVQVHMDEIDLQEQVGKGGFGAVYKGTWRGAVVAVKYAVCNVEDVESLEQSIREVVLSKKMSHPNVVQTYAWTVLAGAEAAGAVRPRYSSGSSELSTCGPTQTTPSWLCKRGAELSTCGPTQTTLSWLFCRPPWRMRPMWSKPHWQRRTTQRPWQPLWTLSGAWARRLARAYLHPPRRPPSGAFVAHLILL